MGKVYKGYELYKAIANGEIEENSKFKDNNNQIWRWNGFNFVAKYDYNDYVFSLMDFELLEDEEIDTQKIEELKTLGCNIETDNGMIVPTENLACDYIISKINEIIRVVNKMQLDNKIKEK